LWIWFYRTEEDDHFPQTEEVALAAYQHKAEDPLHQRFSITVHPRLPLILASDGFMVTALQLPRDITCLSMMKGLVNESHHHLSRVKDQKKIKLTLFDRNKVGAICQILETSSCFSWLTVEVGCCL